MSEELKPCPFCGGTDAEEVRDMETGLFAVQCPDCSANILGYTPDEAKDLWNTRQS